MVIFLCEDSVDGVFTGIYMGWESKLGHDNIKLSVRGLGSLELFAEYREVETDADKANKVARTLYNRLGQEAYECICQALMTNDEEKGNAVYHMVVAGFRLDSGRNILHHLTNYYVRRVFEMSRSAGNEGHHLLGFVRFQELANGILFSVIRPKNNVLTLLAPHFADRLPLENWVIYDEGRSLFLVHEVKKQWMIVQGAELKQDFLKNLSEDEEEFKKLWKGFCHSISIKERENLKLQQQNMYMRFRKYMVEFTG